MINESCERFFLDVTPTFLDQCNDTEFETLINLPDFQEYRDKLV